MRQAVGAILLLCHAAQAWFSQRMHHYEKHSPSSGRSANDCLKRALFHGVWQAYCSRNWNGLRVVLNIGPCFAGNLSLVYTVRNRIAASFFCTSSFISLAGVRLGCRMTGVSVEHDFLSCVWVRCTSERSDNTGPNDEGCHGNDAPQYKPSMLFVTIVPSRQRDVSILSCHPKRHPGAS